ncbi:hypothetical protein ABIB37_000810 [Agrococcus sp. UYP10]
MSTTPSAPRRVRIAACSSRRSRVWTSAATSNGPTVSEMNTGLSSCAIRSSSGAVDPATRNDRCARACSPRTRSSRARCRSGETRLFSKRVDCSGHGLDSHRSHEAILPKTSGADNWYRMLYGGDIGARRLNGASSLGQRPPSWTVDVEGPTQPSMACRWYPHRPSSIRLRCLRMEPGGHRRGSVVAVCDRNSRHVRITHHPRVDHGRADDSASLRPAVQGRTRNGAAAPEPRSVTAVYRCQWVKVS